MSFSYKILISVFLGIFVTIGAYARYKREFKDKIEEPRYMPLIYALQLPVYIVLYASLYLLFDFDILFEYLIYILINFLVILSIFYLILILLLPILRKYLSSRTISLLWVIPNFLYFYLININLLNILNINTVLILDKRITYSLSLIWLLGFVIILLWKIIEHFKYEKYLFQDCIECNDSEILEIFHYELKKAKSSKNNIICMISNRIETPLTIGITKKKLLLPNKSYTKEEYQMIFRHEIIHIEKQDIETKFFLIFCTALCWFNPLMWIAFRRCSEDIELSCDESVLLKANERERKQYANLILSSANCEKGFTTCLSANAHSLKYRLKSILSPKKKYIGGIFAGLAIFLLSICFGSIGLAFNKYNAKEIMYTTFDMNQCVIEDIYVPGEYQHVYEFKDDSIHEYLSKLTLSEMINNINRMNNEKIMSFTIKNGNQSKRIHIYDQFIKIDNKTYYVHESIDQKYISSLLKSYPAINANLLLDKVSLGNVVSSTLVYLEKNNEIIYMLDNPEMLYYDEVHNYQPTHVKLDFSNHNIKDINIQLHTVDEKHGLKLNKDDLIDSTFELPFLPVKCHIEVIYYEENEQYKAIYYLNIK